MKRKIDLTLDTWLSKRKQAILLYGARQSGKTYAIRECFKRNRAPYVEINFATDKTALSLFARLADANDFYTKLSLCCNGSLEMGRTCVFLDEIQEVYSYREELKKTRPEEVRLTIDPIALMKELVEDGRFRYAISGSLLGIKLSQISSVPIGYLDKHILYPLDFEEFLWAKGIGDEAIDYLRLKYLALEEIDETIHNKFLRLFRQYILVGGMPEAVKEYAASADLNLVSLIHRSIVEGYRDDIQKYAPKENRLLIGETYDSLASELNRKDKHFRKSKLDYPNSKNIDMENAFLWLTEAGVAIPCRNVACPCYPLTINEQRKTLKLFYNDIGLLCSSLLDKEGAIKILDGDSSINFGAPYENVIAQELFAHSGASSHYLNSKKYGEIDFLTQKNGEVVPLEIKSGEPNRNGFFAHKALDNALKAYPSIKRAFVLSKRNIAKENEKIANIPFYCVMFCA